MDSFLIPLFTSSVTPTPTHWRGTLPPLAWAPISRSQAVTVALCPIRCTSVVSVTAGEPPLLFVGRPACVEMGRSPAKSENLCGSRVLGVNMALLSSPRPRTSQLRTKPRMLTSAGSSALNESSVLFLKGRGEAAGGKPTCRGQTWPHRSSWVSLRLVSIEKLGVLGVAFPHHPQT